MEYVGEPSNLTPKYNALVAFYQFRDQWPFYPRNGWHTVPIHGHRVRTQRKHNRHGLYRDCLFAKQRPANRATGHVHLHVRRSRRAHVHRDAEDRGHSVDKRH